MGSLYHDILVAVDNSECSNSAVDLAVALAKAMKARLTSVHVYAARLHDTRFRQLEPGLPERYQQEEMLHRQRRIHDDLIGRGLGIISDSYLRIPEEKAVAAGVAVTRKVLEGRNYAELVKEARENRYDLVILGAHGLGRVGRSVLGSVCERVVRLADGDVLVVREGCPLDSGELVVAIDGSPHSFQALQAALDLSRTCGSPLAAVAAYDPFFHSSAFRSLAGVLSEEASRMFRFREQEELHEEIIDGGLRQVYLSHLVQAREMAEREGISLEIEVLEGKPFDAISAHLERTRPALLLVGRVGIHHEEGVALGSTAENLLRLAPCNVLVVGGVGTRAGAEPEPAEEPPASRVPLWSEEARARLDRIPPFVRTMVRRRIEGFAREKGFLAISLEVYEQALKRFGM